MGDQLTLFANDAVAIDDRVRAALPGAVVAFSLSGGKDSTAAMRGAWEFLDEIGHPRADRVAIHADLGRAEWQSTPAMVEEVAAHFGAPLMVVRHASHDMVSRWEARFDNGKRRYRDLEIFNLIGPWSSASLRFCTAEMKQQVIAPALTRAFPGRTIISVVGIRRDESPGRGRAPISKVEPRWARADGSNHLTWHPALFWSAAEVFHHHRRYGLPLSEVYTVHGCTRLSCAFCIMQSLADQVAAAKAPGNRGLLCHLVDMEVRSSFSFQPARWLADAAPQFLPVSLLADVARGKVLASRRRAIEAALPAGLRYVEGWPVRLPTREEAVQVVAARAEILLQHGLPVLYRTPTSVIARFDELMAIQAAKAAAKAQKEAA